MASPSRTAPSPLLTAQGLLQLGVGSTIGVTRIAEAVHMAVLNTTPLGVGPLAPLGRAVTRAAYAGVRGVAGAVGTSGERLLDLASRAGDRTPDAEAKASAVTLPLPLRSALNGVAGDHLEQVANPLAIPMAIHPAIVPRLRRTRAGIARREALFVHGLCMNDRQWQGAEKDGACLGEHLWQALGHVPTYLRYNSGIAIAENGRRLAELLEDRHPRKGADRPMDVVAHSLGGLIVRSAFAHGLSEGHRWPEHIRHVVFLGTPHEGAPLERAGKLLDALLSTNRFSAPFAEAGRLRSLAIRQLGQAELPPLPAHALTTRFHAVAGTLAPEMPTALADRLGDGLVPTGSALADRVPTTHLRIDSRRVFARVGHVAMIRHPEVAQHISTLLRD